MMQSSSTRRFPGTPPRVTRGSTHEAMSGIIGILLEVGQFVSLLLCILCLYAFVHTVFFTPFTSTHERLLSSFKMFLLAAGVCSLSGWIFAEEEWRQGNPNPCVSATLPMKAFFWVTLAILILFLVSWYLEEYFLPLRAQPLW
jgi:hypothetical protein